MQKEGSSLMKQIMVRLNSRRFKIGGFTVFFIIANYIIANQLYNFTIGNTNSQKEILNFLAQISVGAFAALIGVLAADTNAKGKYSPHVRLSVIGPYCLTRTDQTGDFS